MGLWNDKPQAGAHSNTSSSDHASMRAGHAQQAASELQDRLNRLVLVCEAMWSLLQERTGLTERDLNERVKELDMQDGQLDGKRSRTNATCQKCQSAIIHRARKCTFCGELYQAPDAFSSI